MEYRTSWKIMWTLCLLISMSYVNCDAANLTCADGTRLPRAVFRDGVNDCGDNSDEVTTPCDTPLFSCLTTPIECVNMSQVDDGTADCSDSSDEVRYLLDTCGKNNECDGNCTCNMFVNHSVCREGICQCDVGYVNVSDRECSERRLLEPCEFDNDCTLINNSACVGNICQCFEGFTPNEFNTSCIEVIPEVECTNDSDCDTIKSHAECIAGLCVCKPGYKTTEDGLNCVLRKVYDSCVSNMDCSSAVNMSICSNNSVCVCDMGYTDDENETICRLRTINDVCDMTSECEIAVEHSICVNEACECEPGYQASDFLDECTLRRIGDSTCKQDGDCNAAVINSGCINGTCTCSPGYLVAENNTVCTRRMIGDVCDDDYDCFVVIDNSTCVNNSCQCSSEFRTSVDKAECVSKLLGEVCNHDMECGNAILNSYCFEGICRCDSGFKGENLTFECIPLAIDDLCKLHEDCQISMNNTICFNGACACRQGYKPTDDKTNCTGNRIGEKCKVNEDCSNSLINSECDSFYKTCRCSVGYNANKAGDVCKLRKIYDKTCVYDKDCSAAVEFSQCSGKTCICEGGYYTTDDNATCTMFRVGDSGCSRTRRDCSKVITKSDCIDGVCECDKGYVPENNGTKCRKREIGDPCGDELDCTKAISRSVCLNGTCACPSKYDALPDNTDCVARPDKLLIGLPCYFDAQCERLDNRSFCGTLFDSDFFRSCQCIDGYLVREDRVTSGECYVPEKVGDYCKLSMWCQKRLGNDVACVENVCSCRNGYIPSPEYNGCIPLPTRVNQFCRTDEHCGAIKHAECHGNQTCQCHYMYVNSKDGTTCTKLPLRTVPVPQNVAIGIKCDNTSVTSCDRYRDGRKNMTCGYLKGRKNARCKCVPGYASRYDNEKIKCEEIQTYFFYINITLERGCDLGKDGDTKPLCFIYQPIKVTQFNTNPDTNYYTRARIEVSGMANLFLNLRDDIKNRYINSEIINITKADDAMRVAILVYLRANYSGVIDPGDLKAEMIKALIKSDGQIGSSQMKIVWPFAKEIEYRDFNECTEGEAGEFSDCSKDAYCLNTMVSYMCSCKYILHLEDQSPDTDRRPGRICAVPIEDTTHSLSCSTKDCETQWEYIGLALVAFGLMMLFFIGYEIHDRKKKLEKSDIYYKIQKAARKAKIEAIRERRKTIKKQKKEEKKGKGKEGKEVKNDDEEQLVETV